jgi:N5-hydroxyornithine acetyltransferase
MLTTDRLAQYCMDAGFYKEREISFPHKQANVMKIKRDAWEGPAL